MKIALIGSSGQLAADIILANKTDNYNYNMAELTHESIEISDYRSVANVLEVLKPEVIINTAAYNQVDDCEAGPGPAYLVNALGARNLAIVANKLKAVLIHISTDYVFDGCRADAAVGYNEFDSPNPINVYGKSKLAGEDYIRSLTDKYIICRTAWLFGKGGQSNRGNFARAVLQMAESNPALHIVDDQVGSPTSTFYLARQLLRLAETPYYGTYHTVCQGMASWYDFAVEIKRVVGFDTPIIPVSSKEFPRPANRPGFSALDNYVLKLQGLNLMPFWQEALAEYLSDIV